MDPLTITTAVMAVAGLAASTGRAFSRLRLLCRTLPGRLHALSNEVTDIELVLYQVAGVVKKRANEPALREEQDHISTLLKQARSKLEELRLIVERLIEKCELTKVPLFRARVWRKDQPRLQALQEDIKTVKCSLNIMLGASNSHDMMRIRVDLETISAAGSQLIQDQDTMQDGLHMSLAHYHDRIASSFTNIYDQVDNRIANVEKLLQTQSLRLQTSQFDQMGTAYGNSASPSRRKPQSPGQTQYPGAVDTQDMGVRVTQYGACCDGCPCSCHTQRRNVMPGIVDRVLGQIFIGYAGLPLISSKCDTTSCEKTQAVRVSLEYWFPLGFVWSQILRFRLTYQPIVGPSLDLSTFRRVPDSAQCINFALNGNIDGLKYLFSRGLASPRDISSTRGYSVLRWAMYAKQYQTCKFLVHAGADLDYRPIAASDNSPRNKAHQFLLMGGLSVEDVEALRSLTQGSDFVEEQNYTLLHKIVLGLSMKDLEQEIRRHPEHINTTDVMGRTPLAWAACRGDERAIVTLLQYEARVDTIDVQHSGVVGHAADRSYAACVRLLLEAGADPDIAAKFGHKVGNPLNVAARNASDPLVLKTLLDFGADIESSGVDGNTPLIHASRRDNASFATLLLEYGANINAISAAGQTPLTTAIAFNSHNVLQLLLDRWFEYSVCPRLTGPHLLQIMALYADAKTMSIFTATDHLVLHYDQNYVLGDFVSQLNDRADATEKLIQAFMALLGAIKSPQERCVERPCPESGLLSEKYNDKSDAESSDQEFENALESLPIRA